MLIIRVLTLAGGSSEINDNILWHPSNPVENKATINGQFF